MLAEVNRFFGVEAVTWRNGLRYCVITSLTVSPVAGLATSPTSLTSLTASRAASPVASLATSLASLTSPTASHPAAAIISIKDKC